MLYQRRLALHIRRPFLIECVQRPKSTVSTIHSACGFSKDSLQSNSEHAFDRFTTPNSSGWSDQNGLAGDAITEIKSPSGAYIFITLSNFPSLLSGQYLPWISGALQTPKSRVSPLYLYSACDQFSRNRHKQVPKNASHMHVRRTKWIKIHRVITSIPTGSNTWKIQSAA